MKQQALLETDQALALLQTFPPFDLMTVLRLREELMLASTYLNFSFRLHSNPVCALLKP